jgi:ABC-type nitrate/sulfonate/bicarbonate transport system ATPase subunit
MATVELRNVRKQFGNHEVIHGIDLLIQDHEFIAFVGPSGCGKSTLLRMIAGLEQVTDGEVLIDGSPAQDVPPAKRGLAMVFQSYALYPHMTVAENMSFSLRLSGASKAEREQKVRAVARILEMEPLLERKPSQLSGGQLQRVAIGRAMVRQPKAFLMDEPLSNLDAALQGQMRLELARLHRELNTTMIYAFAIDPHPRNVPDDVLRLMPANGGVVHVNFIPDFVSPKFPEWQEKRTAALKDLHARLDSDEAIAKGIAEWEKANIPPGGTISEVADHIDHIRKVAGVDHIGIGADFSDVIPGSMVAGLENVTRYPYLFAELLRRGSSDDDVLKIAGRNHLRAMRQMERVAAGLQKSEAPLISEGVKAK